MGIIFLVKFNKTMKLIILLVAFATLASAKPLCSCGLFMTNKNHEVEIKKLHPMYIENCNQHQECLAECAKVVNQYTKNGDLEADYGIDYGLTVGQEICLQAQIAGYENIYWEPVYGYAKACDGPWDWTGVQMKQLLCCRHGHYRTCGS